MNSNIVSDTPGDEETVKYLTILWNYNNKHYKMNIFNNIYNYITNIYYRYKNSNLIDLTYTNIKDKLSKLKKLGWTYYNGSIINNEFNEIEHNNNNINNAINFKNGTNLTRKDIMKKISYCTVFAKYKSGDKSQPENYRYFINHHNTIKILDRIWYNEIITLIQYNLPNKDIFKLPLNKMTSIIDVVNNNTLSLQNVILLDLQKAYDSLEWDIIQKLLYNNLSKKMNSFYAADLVNQYMTIIINRIVRYNKKIVQIYKGLPTGLPSSSLIFTLIIEEIILEWLNSNNYIINIDFILNIYIDDFYIKIINLNKTKHIISSLIKILNKYKLIINYSKSKADITLNLSEFNVLTEKDLYLGIPFTRNIGLYKKIILEELYKKHKLTYSWSEIYDIISSDNHEKKSLLTGFMNYKMSPLMSSSDNLITYIKSIL